MKLPANMLFRVEPTSRLLMMLIDNYALRSYLYSHGHGPDKHEPAPDYAARFDGLRRMLESEIDYRIPEPKE